MLCENCKQNEASVHTVTIINGEKQEHHLCNTCAKGVSVQFSLPSLINLLSSFQSMPQQAEVETCQCGNSFLKFQQTGLLGCPQCYDSYRQLLLPVIKRVQGGRIRHVGRRPAQFVSAQTAPAKVTESSCKPVDECARLREELKQAVREEQYERAAELRDRLRLMEGGIPS